MKHSIAILLLATALASCNAIDRLTGRIDNTVLPGNREEAIPGQASFPTGSAGGPATAADPAAPQAETAAAPEEQAPVCPADDPDCTPPAVDGTFSDGQ
ncbi:MAG: hypothetical protein ACT4SY_00830 [Hyphomicrobiales bacterium]